MKLAKFSLGQIVATGIAATVFLIALHYLGNRGVPGFRQVSAAVKG